MWSQLIQTVNISVEICANVFTADPNWQYFKQNMCKCVHSWSKLSIVHWKYAQMCSQLIQTVNISFEKFANVFTADPNCQYFIWNMCKCVHSWSKLWIFHLKYVQMCSQLIQNVNISLEKCANVFTADPNCEYFIWNMCKCVNSWSKLWIFHLKYVQMCSQLIQTVNIFGNMCKCVHSWSQLSIFH